MSARRRATSRGLDRLSSRPVSSRPVTFRPNSIRDARRNRTSRSDSRARDSLELPLLTRPARRIRLYRKTHNRLHVHRAPRRRLVKRLAARTALAHGDDVAPEALWHHLLLLLFLLFYLASRSRHTATHTGRANDQRESTFVPPYICTRSKDADAYARIGTGATNARSPQKFARETRSTVPH